MISKVDIQVRAELAAIYEEIMWLAARPNVSPSMARAWYTHITAGKLNRRIRQFSGKVSRAAIDDPFGTLRLEHHARIQTTLTSLVASHIARKKPNKAEFIRTVIACENVHIVTFTENYAAMKAGGDYKLAGIKLVSWRSIPDEIRSTLWPRMLRGKVANAGQFAPKRRT